MSTSTPYVPRRNTDTEADLIAQDLAIELDDDSVGLADAWEDHPFTQQTPVIQTVDPKNVCMVVDDASMTYRVRSSTGNKGSGGRIARGLRRITGAGWAEVHALSNLSFIVNRGESVGVIGTNGSGKSTLMKLLTGKVRPTSGEVYATSTPVMLGVNAALVKEISGRENIRLGCLAMGLSPEQTAAKYDQIVEISGLSDALEMPLKTYSSGMSSRLQFAIATSVDPDILLIDEALNTGDAQFRARTKERLDEVRANAGAVFLVSHSLGTIKQMCTRVIWIEQGEMLADGDPQWVCEQYEEYTSHKSNGRMRAAKVVYERTRLRLDPIKVDFTSGSRPKKAGGSRSR
ncbi:MULTISPECIES: ABC transporter ATP-binding protein [unclassified Nesterenkonia]|uniref:ABC transporter ATP-binding protein n=1 Tax=unclassified Nesterenkonia TaxID=2629769 RepID=UPI001F4C6423|nr:MULTISPECIES: ABC transporter ATP-binding protein [unclassified Nesterenkonia]MCH8561200.1 ABC transporter ATP-binding protein [Nesterenkonia sp. DZ6]MCH8571334.1 ABC transporter ATP-binding protein [Nesterenkonia sp. AY15]